MMEFVMRARIYMWRVTSHKCVRKYQIKFFAASNSLNESIRCKEIVRKFDRKLIALFTFLNFVSLFTVHFARFGDFFFDLRMNQKK